MNIRTKNNRVRFIAGSLDIGGTEKHLSLVLPELKDKVLNPIVITLTHKGQLAHILEAKGIKVYEPGPFTRRVQRIPVLSRILGPCFTIIYLVTIFLKNPGKLTCFYLPSSYYLGMVAAMLTGESATTVMFRRSLNVYQKNRPLFGYFERQLHKKTKAIVGNSRAVTRQLAEEEGVPEDKLTLIYNGIDISSFLKPHDRSTTRDKLGIGHDVLVLCIVANLIPYKGHDDLINALALIADKIDQPWLLLCIGKEIVTRQDLQNLVKTNQLTDHVRWLGQRQDVVEILSASDIGLLVSHQEGFSNSLLEGMAAGLPMIVTDVGGNSEAVLDKHTGLVVRPHNPAELSQAIMTLIDDPDLARQYGEKARARVEEHFTIDSCVENYKNFFNALLQNQSGRE